MYEFKAQKQWQKPMTTVLKRNYDTEKNTSDAEKIKNYHNKNFKDEANNMQLDKEDTQQSNLTSEVAKNNSFCILILLFVFVFNKPTC